MTNQTNEVEGISNSVIKNRLFYRAKNYLELGMDKLVGGEKSELVEQTSRCFEVDMTYMLDVLEKDAKFGFLNNTVEFRGLIVINPIDSKSAPILITRPDLEFGPRDYENGDGASMFHDDIWKGWEIEADRHPDSERAKIVSAINLAGGYDKMEHIYLKLKKDENNNVLLQISAGWSKLVASDDPESLSLIQKMTVYGIDSVNNSRWEDDSMAVETLILEDMLKPLIDKNAEKLAEILPSSSVRQYRNLAKVFMTTPNPNRNSKLYMKYLEYEEMLR